MSAAEINWRHQRTRLPRCRPERVSLSAAGAPLKRARVCSI
jgi:hypothetical protein